MPHVCSFPGGTTAAGHGPMVSGIEAAHGPIALAFLNAGVYFIAERDGFSAGLVWRTFEINVGGTVNCQIILQSPLYQDFHNFHIQTCFSILLPKNINDPFHTAYCLWKLANINTHKHIILPYFPILIITRSSLFQSLPCISFPI